MAYTALDRPDAQATRRRVWILAAASLVLFSGLIAAYFVKQQFGSFSFSNTLPFKWIVLPPGSEIVKIDRKDKPASLFRGFIADFNSRASWPEICAKADRCIRQHRNIAWETQYDATTIGQQSSMIWCGQDESVRTIVQIINSSAFTHPICEASFRMLAMEFPVGSAATTPDLLRRRQSDLETNPGQE